MWLTKLFTALMIVLAGIIPSSCVTSKKPVAQQLNLPVTTVAGSSEDFTNKNLGELQLTNHYETCVNLGAGKSCTIKPSLLNNSDLQITMALESISASGKVNGLSVVEVVTKTGQPFEVAVGDMNITLTPKLADE
jgi:hypothetical protein